MAKGYNTRKSVRDDSDNRKNGHNVITLSTGKRATIVGVSHMYFQDVQNSVEFPEKPTYEAITAGGAVEKHVIDQTVVDDPTNTQEEKADYESKLRLYEEELHAAQVLQTTRVNDFLFTKGLEIEPISDVELMEWIEESEMFGIEISDKPLKRKLQYVKTRVIGNTQDFGKLLNAVMEATGVPEEKLAEAKKLFQGNMEETS